MLIYLQMLETDEERSKFEILYLEYRGLMYHVAYEILKNEQDAEDAVHHAFIKVAENFKKVGEIKSPKTKSFLITITENRAIDIVRARTRHPEVPYDENTVGIQVEYNGSFVLAQCLAKMPPRQREAIILKYHHEYTNREIGKILGITELAAKKLVQRARQSLEELYKKETTD